MRLAILSDIHGNIVALDSVMADLANAGAADRFWVLGDLALFGSNPGAVIQQIRNLPNAQVLRGNTDRYIVTGVRPTLPGPENVDDWEKMPDRLANRDETFRWTFERIGFEHYTYLADLPTALTIKAEGYGTLTAFHAAPGDDELGFMPDTPDDSIAGHLAGIDARLIVVGHTHLPMDREVGDYRVLNPGSVGLPFDGDPRAAYALLDFDDSGKLTIDLRRVPYEIDKAVDFLHALDHPSAAFQAARLRQALMHPSIPGD